MSNVDKSERLSFTQLLLGLLAFASSIIAAVVVVSLVVDPMRYFLTWVVAFLVIALSICGAAGYLIVSRFLSKSGREIGTVTKKWAGLGKELFTSADNYVIALTDLKGASPAASALLLAAGLAIDIVFKENQ